MSFFTARIARKLSASYKRRYRISSHARDRFRERVDAEDLGYRSDDDVMNLLDNRVSHAAHQFRVCDPRKPAAVTTLFEVPCIDGLYYAVERENTVVTLLDAQMARNNFGEQWTPVINNPFEKLRDLKIAIAAKPSVSAALPATASPASPVVDPLESARDAYARARALQHAREEVVAAALSALREASAMVDVAHQHLIEQLTKKEH